MKKYTEQELDARIDSFLNRMTAKFPELQSNEELKNSDKYEGQFGVQVNKAVSFWTKYIHA